MTTRTIINRSAGPANDRVRIERAVSDSGLSGETEWVEAQNLTATARRALDQGASRILIGGGDGTISSVAGVVAGSDAALAILPLGTLNHFARDLGLPLDPAQAARVAADAKVRTVDLAEVNGRAFVNNSAIGLYPLMVVDREGQQRRLGRRKRFAMLVAGIRTLARFNHQRLTLAVNDREATVETPLLFVGNNEYRLDIAGGGRRDRLDSGELFVLVMRSKTRLGFLAATMRALLGRTRSDDMVQLSGVTRMKVDSHRSQIVLSVDGEVVRMRPPLEYRIRPKALRVIVP